MFSPYGFHVFLSQAGFMFSHILRFGPTPRAGPSSVRHPWCCHRRIGCCGNGHRLDGNTSEVRIFLTSAGFAPIAVIIVVGCCRNGYRLDGNTGEVRINLTPTSVAPIEFDIHFLL